MPEVLILGNPATRVTGKKPTLLITGTPGIKTCSKFFFKVRRNLWWKNIKLNHFLKTIVAAFNRFISFCPSKID